MYGKFQWVEEEEGRKEGSRHTTTKYHQIRTIKYTKAKLMKTASAAYRRQIFSS
jgi:hypothetical protein